MNEFDKLFEDIERDPEYLKAHAINDFTLAIERKMHEKGISRADLANRLGVSRAHVTQLLRGETNFTIESMVNLSIAVGGSVHIQVEESACPEAQIEWPDHAAAIPAPRWGGEDGVADNYEIAKYSARAGAYDETRTAA